MSPSRVSPKAEGQSSSVAFLRSMNVGGRRVTNEALVGALADAGMPGAEAFLASGNLILPSTAAVPSAVEAEVRLALETALAFEVPVFVRSESEVRALAAAEPFSAAEIAVGAGKAQVTLLASEPGASEWKQALSAATERDLMRRGERAWFWLPHDGISGTTLKLAHVEKALGVGTTRTLNTMQRIVKKFFGES